MGSRVWHGILLLVLLVMISLAGCSSSRTPPAVNATTVQTTPAGPGPLQDITSRDIPRVSLDDALAALTAAEQEGAIDTRGMAPHQVFGYGVDSAGLARTWVLGMQRGGTTTLLEYNEGGWKELDLPVAISGAEVKIKDLISPQDLYTRHVKAIVTVMTRLGTGESDLTLEDETYQITIHSASGSSTLTFNAKTGELIQSA